MTSLAVIMTLCMDELCACNDHECRDQRVCSQAFYSNNRLVLISRLVGSNAPRCSQLTRTGRVIHRKMSTVYKFTFLQKARPRKQNSTTKWNVAERVPNIPAKSIDFGIVHPMRPRILFLASYSYTQFGSGRTTSDANQYQRTIYRFTKRCAGFTARPPSGPSGFGWSQEGL